MDAAHIERLRAQVRHVIFDSEDRSSRLFDILLILCILISVVGVLLISVPEIEARIGPQLMAMEWTLTIVFTVEYFARLWSAKEPARYARSFFGIIDLLAIVPTYLSLFVPGAQYLIIIRALRTIRVFRILKLLEYMYGSHVILSALRNSRAKIVVFITTVIILVTITGAIMYLVESPTNPGYSSIPASIYWAIVTITTVGYGDISPQTAVGQLLSSMLMLLGYAIIAVPTGIVASEMTLSDRRERDAFGRPTTPPPDTDDEENAAKGEKPARLPPEPDLDEPVPNLPEICPHCGAGDHPSDSLFCRRCGGPLK